MGEVRHGLGVAWPVRRLLPMHSHACLDLRNSALGPCSQALLMHSHACLDISST